MYTDFPEVPQGFHEAIQKALDLLNEQMPLLQNLLSRPAASLSPSEKELIRRLRELFEIISQARNVLEHRLLYQANIYFHHIESLAKEGNAGAQAIYEDLLPSYRAALQEDLDNAAN